MEESLTPTEYDWTNVDSCLISIKREAIQPNENIIVCGCSKDVKDVIIDLNIIFLALSFAIVLATGAMYKCMLLMGSYIFLDHLRSIFSFC